MPYIEIENLDTNEMEISEVVEIPQGIGYEEFSGLLEAFSEFDTEAAQYTRADEADLGMLAEVSL